MNGISLRRGILAALILAVLGAVAGGIAYAETSGVGTLNACAKTATGQLRLDTGTGCLSTEQAVQLGTAAATRADERYFSGLTNPPSFLPLTVGTFPDVLPTATRVVTMHAPAGNYAIAAQVVANDATGSGVVACLLLDSTGATHGFAEAGVGIAAGFDRTQTIVLDGAIKLEQETDIALTCWSQPAGGQTPGNPIDLAADITTKSVDQVSITQETH
jgi:hypothetical protein